MPQQTAAPRRNASMNLTFADEQFVLLADRAVLWPRRSTLIVADTHFGKDSLFQARGIPVPNDVTSNDLARLARLLGMTGCGRLLVLGDFFHGKESNDPTMTAHLRAWRDALSQVEITLIRGNHDVHAGDPCDSLGIETLNSLTVDAIKFRHDPVTDETCETDPPSETASNATPASELPPGTGAFTMCGHVHPATTLTDFDGSVVKVPCFVVDPRQMILPAFGRFTGTCTIARRPGRELLIASHGRVLRAPGK